MRYLICKKDISIEEISARMKYIYGIFHIYTYISAVNSSKNIIELKSIPSNQIDLLIVVGHDPMTNDYIINNISCIPEKNIAVISCNTGRIRVLKDIKNKMIFLPTKIGKIDFYNGKELGFDFEITDEEIKMYRNKNKDFNLILNIVFERI